MNLTPTEPILVLSDLHLGHRASRIKHPEQLAPILDGPGSVIFNGDTSEMRNSEDRRIGRKLAADLARICHQAGRKAFFVNGNHDPTVSSTNHLDLANGAVLVTHGDILFLDVAPWSRAARHYRNKHRQILDGLGPDGYADFEKRLLASKRTSIELQMLEPPLTRGRSSGFRLLIRNCWPPWRPLMIIKAWCEVPGRAADLARVFRPEARFVLVGHTHCPGIWRVAPRVIINTGSFVPYFGACAAILESGGLEVRQISAFQQQFVLGKSLRKFAVAEPQSEAA
ncbi:MAG: metallophosphoesterase family protein [Verrucomicrobia bacterium]|nr:metallophosphoesterase family protein [Verrucomicrobiota bacterium]MBV9130507.1 metallophosphoesterase family protein [Verrucomicrobiota bacterium]MBV9298086.1 metallophosphoesterase family protein [Verrucomicrobiota bacterium]MBV9645243.1 metallophosphoesterase family protein [Verrucomicrobiota bacterium]